MTGVEIQLYKIHPEKYTNTSSNAVDEYRIDKFVAKTFESIGIDLNTPISPMPLPEDRSTENILVKMEGNSQQVRFGCRFDGNLVELSYVEDLTEILTQAGFVNVDTKSTADGGGAYNYGANIITEPDNIQLVQTFLNNFESRSITDTFILRIVDKSQSPEKILFTGGGSIVSINTSTDSASPVVWNVNVDFLVGNVISIYDADVPEEVTGLEVSVPSSGSIKFRWSDPAREGGSAITKFTFVYQKVLEGNWIADNEITYSAAQSTIPSGETKYSYTLTSLPTNKDYKVYIVAENTAGVGAISEIVRVGL
jgi:hypothetical protein